MFREEFLGQLTKLAYYLPGRTAGKDIGAAQTASLSTGPRGKMALVMPPAVVSASWAR